MNKRTRKRLQPQSEQARKIKDKSYLKTHTIDTGSRIRKSTTLAAKRLRKREAREDHELLTAINKQRRNEAGNKLGLKKRNGGLSR